MLQKKKRIVLLGSTGSIGLNSLAVIDSLQDSYELIAVSAHCKWQVLAEQARKYRLNRVVITDPLYLDPLQKALADTSTEVMGGPEYLVELATDERCDILIVSIVGAAGLPAVVAAVKAGKTVAIANKESLVVAGCLLMPMAQEYNATILPIDSEHSAILQSMHSGRREEVEKVIITCSGGPFRKWTSEQLAGATVAQALQHPTWNMGPKITIDSATLMNKALEIIEARWLFGLDPEQIEVLIHPESIIHSLVEFCDGSVIAQLSNPDMKLPIQYALTYPHRLPCTTRRLKLSELGKLTFEPPDRNRFPALRLGFEVARQGGTAGAVLNAANEAAVAAFQAGKIGFRQIAELTEHCLRSHKWIKNPSLDQLLAADRWAREMVASPEKTGAKVS
ncbi:MAG: 1-deoxy-D-xylulose 5-phosphate reductoisomerase [Planctomycetes bacterium ADurb.Bin412]|nr:MAG: 1-deoxy-D-xylulose 5-phosphate reductoisomerase [Planctomycetes bacterium ADurb.Bin412]